MDQKLLGRWPGRHPAWAVVADSGDGRVVDRPVVDVGDVDIVDVVDRAVVEEAVVVPITAFITEAGIAETVSDAAVETHLRAPVAAVKQIGAVVPAPPGGSPQQAWLRR